MRELENRMVDDMQWATLEHYVEEQEEEEDFPCEGFYNKSKDEFIEMDDAYEYALEKCLFGKQKLRDEFKEMLVEWYFQDIEWRKVGCGN